MMFYYAIEIRRLRSSRCLEKNTSSITQYAIVFDNYRNLRGSREFCNVLFNCESPDIPY